MGQPSQKLMEEMGATEIERVKKQCSELGDKGLTDMSNVLRKATEQNEVINLELNVIVFMPPRRNGWQHNNRSGMYV